MWVRARVCVRGETIVSSVQGGCFCTVSHCLLTNSAVWHSVLLRDCILLYRIPRYVPMYLPDQSWSLAPGHFNASTI